MTIACNLAYVQTETKFHIRQEAVVVYFDAERRILMY